jgi:hypothetical protein
VHLFFANCKALPPLYGGGAPRSAGRAQATPLRLCKSDPGNKVLLKEESFKIDNLKFFKKLKEFKENDTIKDK